MPKVFEIQNSYASDKEEKKPIKPQLKNQNKIIGNKKSKKNKNKGGAGKGSDNKRCTTKCTKVNKSDH